VEEWRSRHDNNYAGDYSFQRRHQPKYKELKLYENLALNSVIIKSLVLEIQGYSLQPACLQAGRSIIHPLCGVHKRIFAAIPQPVDR